MGIFEDIFKQENPPEENLFSEEDAVSLAFQRSEDYRKNLAESLSSYYGVSVDESLKAVETNTERKIDNKIFNLSSVYEEAYASKVDVEGLNKFVNNYKNNTSLLSVLSDPYVAEEVIKDPVKTTADRLSQTIAIIDQAAQEVAPKEGYFGLASSLVGLLGYELTGGVGERAATFFDLDAGAWNRVKDAKQRFQDIYGEDDPKRQMALARSLMKEYADLGLLGGNTFRFWQNVETLKSFGVNENVGFNFALDIAGAVPVSRISKLLPFASDAVSVAAASRGTAAANTVMNTALNNPSTASNVAGHSAPAMSRVNNTGLSPSIGVTLQNEVQNDIVQAVTSNFKSQYITEEQIKEVARNRLDFLSRKIKNPVLDYNVIKVDEFDNYDIKVLLGKKDGTKFADQVSAQKYQETLLKEKGILGTVEESLIQGVSDGWVVSFTKNLPLKDFAKPIFPSDLKEYGVFDNVLSPEVTASQDWLTLLKRGIQKIGVIEEQTVKPFANTLNKVSSSDNKIITSIINDLSISKRDWLNTADFKAEYYRLAGKEASQEVVDGYHAIFKMSDTVSRIEADRILKQRLLEKSPSQKISFDGTTFFNAKVDILDKIRSTTFQNTLNQQKFIWNFDTNSAEDIQQVFKAKKNKHVYYFEDINNAPVINGKAVVFAIGTPKASRPITRLDVFNNIPGSFKTSSKLDGFLVQKSTIEDLSGNVLNRLPVIIAAGRTKKELAKIAKGLESVLSVYRANPSDAVAIEAALKIHNGFDPTITTVRDLEEFIQKSGIDITQGFETRMKGEYLPEVGVWYGENYRVGKYETYEDLYNRGTDNDYIYGYGNVALNQIDPTKALTRDYAKAVNYMSNRAANINGIEGLIRGAKQTGVLMNAKNIEGLPLAMQLKEAMFKVGKEGDLYRSMQRTLIQSIREPSQLSLKWESTMKGVSNLIFNTTKVETFDILSTDPVTALRSMAYHMKLGLWNPSQLVLQSFQAMNIMAISPRYGFKAAAAYWPIRAVLVNGSDEAIKLAAKRVGGFLDLTEDQFIQLAKYYRRDSGFFHINNNIYENNATSGFTKGFARKARESSTFFFREGERISRGMATNVAYMEYIKKPGVRLVNGIVDLSDETEFRAFDAFMNKRVDDLTFNMTRASAAGWQEGVLGLATQWQSYTAKTFEAMAFGRNLTGGERARLALTQVGLFGAAGIPLGSYALNIMTDSSEKDIPPRMYTFLQGGLLDTALSTALGEETSMSQRVSPAYGLGKTISDLYDKNFMEALGGPSVNILWKSGDLGIKMITSRIFSEPEVADMDMARLFREVSSFTAVERAAYMLMLGEYIDKRGTTMASDINPWAAMASVFGVDYQKITLQYSIRELINAEKEMVFKLSNRVKDLNKLMIEAIEKDDMTTANGINKDIIALTAPLSLSERADVERFSKPSLMDVEDKLLRQSSRYIKSYQAKQLEAITRGKE